MGTKFTTLGAALLFFISLIITVLSPLTVNASFISNNLMDDGVFEHTASMDTNAIDGFLNTFSASCISSNHGFSAPDPTGYSPSTGFTYGNNVTAGRIIYDAAATYGINPQVILATLQKEQSLVTGGSGCSTLAYAAAAGYGCPDGGITYSYTGINLYSLNGIPVNAVSGTCVNTAAKTGFSQQVIRAAWLLRFGEQRSKGNTGWNVQLSNIPQPGDSWNNSDDPSSCYGGPMTQGTFRRCSSDVSLVAYDGYITIDGVSTHMDTGATAALYWYTPHFSGNQNFVNIFENWFGATRGGYCISPAEAAQTTTEFNNRSPKSASADFIIETGSGSGCVESHVWNSGFTSWQAHIASNLPSINPADTQMLFGNLDGNGIDYPVLFGLQNTGSGKIESHVWSHDLKTWLAHAASNQQTVNPTDCKILMADLGGTGKDQVILACLRNTSSGMIELHQWNPGMQTWAWHAITNMPAVDPTQATVTAGDIDGSGRDSLVLVAYNHTGSGKIEFHVWNPGLWSWKAHIATNMPEVDQANANVQFADIDGSGVDEAILVAYNHTGSGKIEFHVWNPGYQSWQAHISSNQPTP